MIKLDIEIVKLSLCETSKKFLLERVKVSLCETSKKFLLERVKVSLCETSKKFLLERVKVSLCETSKKIFVRKSKSESSRQAVFRVVRLAQVLWSVEGLRLMIPLRRKKDLMASSWTPN